MNLGGELLPENIEDLRNRRIQALQGNAVTQEPTGRDQQGHKIEIATSNPRPVTNASTASGHIEASEVSQVSMTPEQRIEDQIAKQLEETKKLANVLEEIFNIAPTMALLRALDISGSFPEGTRLFALNHGNLAERKLILNNGTPPVRIAILIPGEDDKYTSIVPPIIPAGIETSIPDPNNPGSWISMKAPTREPSSGENQQVRALIQKALRLYYGESKVQKKLPQSQADNNITIWDVSNMIVGIHEMTPKAKTDGLIVPGGDQSLLQHADQVINSPYTLLLEGVVAAAEFAVRGAGVVANTSFETLKGAAEGAAVGAAVGVGGFMAVMTPGAAAVQVITSSGASGSIVGAVAGGASGFETGFFQLGRPSTRGDNTSVARSVEGTVVGTAIGVGAGALAASSLGVSGGGMLGTMAVAGAAAGGVMGARNKFSSAIESSLRYFAPQQALEKSMEAFSKFAQSTTAFSNFDAQTKMFEDLKNANEADKNLKNAIIGAFQPFLGIPKYYKMCTTLTKLIDERLAKSNALMDALRMKIKSIDIRSPLSQKQQYRMAIKKR